MIIVFLNRVNIVTALAQDNRLLHLVRLTQDLTDALNNSLLYMRYYNIMVGDPLSFRSFFSQEYIVIKCF